MPPLHRLKRAETWAGNERIASLVELPGLAAWIHSVPAGSGEAGGDVSWCMMRCGDGRLAMTQVLFRDNPG